MNDVYIFQIGDDLAKNFDDSIVNFNGVNLSTGFGKCNCQRAETSSDFENMIARSDLGESRDSVNCVRINDKVLAESSSRRKSPIGQLWLGVQRRWNRPLVTRNT